MTIIYRKKYYSRLIDLKGMISKVKRTIKEMLNSIPTQNSLPHTSGQRAANEPTNAASHEDASNQQTHEQSTMLNMNVNQEEQQVFQTLYLDSDQVMPIE